jgi:hypothetical protein
MLPTGITNRIEMPLRTLLFRVQRIEKHGHAERIENPNDRRSFLIRLTPEGMRLLRRARPAFRSFAKAVEARLGAARFAELKTELRSETSLCRRRDCVSECSRPGSCETACEVNSDAPVAVGLDGESFLLDPPLRFVSLPGALRVRMPRRASGISPAGAAVSLTRRDLKRLFASPRVSPGIPLRRSPSGRRAPRLDGFTGS